MRWHIRDQRGRGRCAGVLSCLFDARPGKGKGKSLFGFFAQAKRVKQRDAVKFTIEEGCRQKFS